MRAARLLRSTPFRLALTFGFLFVLAFLVTGTIVYAMLKRELAEALDASVRETYSVVASTYSSGDLEDLSAAINTYARLSRSDDQVYLLLDDKGERLAGNLGSVSVDDGLSSVSASNLGLKGDEQFRIMAGNVGRYRLVFGHSFAETDEVEETALASFAWGAGVIVALAFGGGAILANRAQHRLQGIARAMSEVSNGNLSPRIPLSGNGDDIDVVSKHMNEALDRLSALVEGMRQVSADIAHDLKTPLNRLRMTIEQAMQQSERGEDVQDRLVEARAESDRINATFEALLRISQIEAGARKTRFRPVDLMDVLQSVSEIYRSVAEDNDQELEFISEVKLPCMIVGDRELLTQLFVNLIENAITHCPPKTQITMKLAVDGRSFRVTVADDGPGIPAGERELVFRRLYRLDKSRTTPGSGLGLSLVKAIADLHAASIVLDDRKPGLDAILRFPAQQLG
ncbi:HAMP domain-containing histidine kinase (plasmid) [Sinorhizobium numidicum]|uniref:histidine kinase n=1 Tax=Sinorhizobium numidicum TaxID=680248 RepID=A0ABY8D678_9HYPH|nr:HAMP domain-containing sensor histidine kinase [Sinorhizobium numidicum]WEX79442.1 HAMP domain-containing histidine kinase [Sinorhizobium numidicum]WEX85602.1 HAMP domain-containing histidine kinase [Sinorhizobium numidicum]